MIGVLVQGRVRIRIRVRVGVMFYVRAYHWGDCRRRKCRTFLHDLTNKRTDQALS